MNDLDFPPVYEELKEQRRRRRLLLGLPLATVFLIGAYFGVPAVVHEIRGWQSRRLAREAEDLVERAKWPEASSKARDAYALRPTEPEAWRAVARLLNRTDQRRAALEWWKRLAASSQYTLDDRRDYAGSALFVDALPEAAAQINGLPTVGDKFEPRDALLISQLALRQKDFARAVAFARRALTDTRAKPNELISAALQIVGLTPRDSADYAVAWGQLVKLARDPANALSLNALNLLADPQILPPLESWPAVPGTSAVGGPAGMTPEEIATALDHHPQARSEDRLRAWELRLRTDPSHAGQLLSEAGARFSNSDDGTLASLVQFLNAHGQAEISLQVLSPDRAEQSAELSSAYMGTLDMLGLWREMKDALATARLRLDPVAQHVYLATARTKSNEPQGADVEWQRALDSAGTDANKLLALAAYEEQMGVWAAADAAYAAAVAAAPEQRAVYTARAQLTLRRGQLPTARQRWAEIVRRWPDDMAARVAMAYCDLLLGGTGADAVRDGEAARSLASTLPPNWPARATLALARLRSDQAVTAMLAFNGDRGAMDPQAQPGADVPSGARAVWAVTLAANGWHTEAERAAHQVADTTLLPEERALIAPLLTPAARP